MYSLTHLNVLTAPNYARMTFPLYQHLVKNFQPGGPIIAIGATTLEQPVGLVLAHIPPDGDTAEVLSIFVAPSHRCTGIGTNLLTHLEQVLHQRGCIRANLVYTTGNPTRPAIERLLQKCRWSSPQPRQLVCQSTTEKIADAPWMREYNMPASFTVFPWSEITQEERLSIQQRQVAAAWIPEDLVPFIHEPGFEPLNSLGLRYQDLVVGWVITHRLGSDTIRYTCSFVREDFQRRGRIIPMYVEAIKRQARAGILNGIWTVPFVHTSMVNFVQRRMAPYMTSITESRGTFKSLSDKSRQARATRSLTTP